MKPLNIRAMILALGGLLMLSSGTAQTPENDAVAAEELRAQLEIAREEVAAAAQRLARLQRELIEAEGGLQGWAWKDADGELEEFELDLNLDDVDSRLRQITMAAFPPRLGVLLDSTETGAGNRIVGVTPGSGAEEAGLREGDLLLEVDGKDVRSDTGKRVREALAAVEPRASVDVLVARDDGATEIVVPVTVRSAIHNIRLLSGRMAPALEHIEREIIRVHPHGPDAPTPPAPPRPPRPPHLAGLGHDTDLISNHSGLATYFGTGEGVIVLRIDADNPLHLEPGDVILSIDGEGVQRPVDLGRVLINREPGDDITVEVMRQGNRTQLYGTIPERRLGGRVGLLPPPPAAL
jgi:S1-C subfamily serine protease